MGYDAAISACEKGLIVEVSLKLDAGCLPLAAGTGGGQLMKRLIRHHRVRGGGIWEQAARLLEIRWSNQRVRDGWQLQQAIR